MRRHTFRTTLTLCAAAGLAAAVVPASAAAPQAPPAPEVVAVDCAARGQDRPGDYIIACGDGNNRLTRLRWTSWGPDGAVGTGVNVVNDCRPYCAAGTLRSYPVTVRLDRAEVWKAQPDLRRFTELTLSYPEASPDQAARVTYRLPG
ncbi:MULTISPECIES: hypothetical protein [Streptomyces]|uniref:Secreted protein n=1 Tax=Streptomyces lichenis TaxID=2306967 RepID=A0ABT0IHL5_9ACTN|nr:hypothetical protein [Streptomyces lichenis]MCK8680813.1 hypothetical protein [Streptomyces lichenis]